MDWWFCEAADPQAKGCVERLQDFLERSFEPGRSFANELDFQLQLDTWFSERANARQHKTLRCRPVDRLVEEREVMASLPARPPDVDRRWVLRVAPDPYLRFDTCDYSLDPALVGRRVEAASPTARCWRSPWTPASWPAATRAPSRGIARSPTSHTPARCAPGAASQRTSRSSRSARWSATTR